MKLGDRTIEPYKPYPKMLYNGNQATVVDNAEQHKSLIGWTESRDHPEGLRGEVAPSPTMIQFRQARPVAKAVKPSKADGGSRFTETT